MLGLALKAVEDKSWKIRLAFAKELHKIAAAFGAGLVDNHLV